MVVLIQYGEQRQIFPIDEMFMFTVKKAFKIENSDIIFQEYDEDWQEYIDIQDLTKVEDKAKLKLVLKENKQDGNKASQWQESPAFNSSASSISTLSVETDLSELSDDEGLSPPSKQAKDTIQSEEPHLPDGLPKGFQLPRHFGPKIDSALRVGDVDNKVRNAVVRTVATCVSAVVKKPTPSMCEFLAKNLIQKYPCLREKDPRDYLKAAGVKVPSSGKPFKNWMMLKRQLQRKFENMKSGSHPTKEENSGSCSSAQEEEAEPDGEVYDDPVTTQRNISKLKAELSKAKWNTKTVTELLKATFTERRKAIQKFDARNRIKKALEDYRCLGHQVEFEAELLNCLQKAYGIDLSIEDMVSSWRRLIDPLLNMAKKMRILTTIEEDPDNKEIMALKCLPKLFKLQTTTTANAEKHFIVFVEDESLELSKEKAPSTSPFLMVSPGQQVFLMQNNKDEFLEVLDDDGLARAVICLVGIYYVFHLDYPGPAKGVFLFLQEHIFHHFLLKRPLRYAARLAELQLPCV